MLYVMGVFKFGATAADGGTHVRNKNNLQAQAYHFTLSCFYVRNYVILQVNF